VPFPEDDMARTKPEPAAADTPETNSIANGAPPPQLAPEVQALIDRIRALEARADPASAPVALALAEVALVLAPGEETHLRLTLTASRNLEADYRAATQRGFAMFVDAAVDAARAFETSAPFTHWQRQAATLAEVEQKAAAAQAEATQALIAARKAMEFCTDPAPAERDYREAMQTHATMTNRAQALAAMVKTARAAAADALRTTLDELRHARLAHHHAQCRRLALDALAEPTVANLLAHREHAAACERLALPTRLNVASFVARALELRRSLGLAVPQLSAEVEDLLTDRLAQDFIGRQDDTQEQAITTRDGLVRILSGPNI
jgi:hypothetical protein